VYIKYTSTQALVRLDFAEHSRTWVASSISSFAGKGKGKKKNQKLKQTFVTHLFCTCFNEVF
jgi:hypothetical protein